MSCSWLRPPTTRPRPQRIRSWVAIRRCRPSAASPVGLVRRRSADRRLLSWRRRSGGSSRQERSTLGSSWAFHIWGERPPRRLSCRPRSRCPGGRQVRSPTHWTASPHERVYRDATYQSERDARSFARTVLGKDPVQVETGKLRSADGGWQYRGKVADLEGHHPGDPPHIHLERLDPETGEVLENWHLYW